MSAYIREKTTCETVGELLDALSKYPRDMPVHSDLEDKLIIYREERDDGSENSICIEADF